MNSLYRRRTRRGTDATLTGTLTLLVLGTIAPLSAHAAITCTTAQTISGPHSGVISVAGGQKVCLKAAVQNGAVNVAPNGQLSVRDSTITGAVTLKSNYTAFEFCGSKTVRGAISAPGGQKTPLIGDGGACTTNTIDGAVTLNANKAGIMLSRNLIAGAVTASANLQGGFLGIGAAR